MIDVFSDHREVAQRSAVPLTPARDTRRRRAIFPPIQVSFLFAEIDDNGRFPGMALGHVRGDEIAHRVIRAATAQGRRSQYKSTKARDVICASSSCREILHQWRASFCYSSCSDSSAAVFPMARFFLRTITNRSQAKRHRLLSPDRAAVGRGNQRRVKFSSETAGKYSPASSRFHQAPVARCSSAVVNRYS